jgi:tetratricopeptide (TPR) repeat protein
VVQYSDCHDVVSFPEAVALDKYEKKVRVNQIVSCIRKGEYKEAQDVADTIDWRQEKSIRTLRMVSEVYKINRRYEDALTVLNLAYERDPENPIKKKIVYDLCELAIKMNQFGFAVRYMKEFSKLAPRDPGRFILQYRLLRATDADYNERIELLEEFKRNHYGDLDAKWAFELANLYHLTNQSDKCVKCCDEIAVWFVTGPYVIKALKLKKEHQPLSYEEEQKIISAEEGAAQDEVIYQKKHRADTAPVYVDTTPVIGDGYSTSDVEDRISPSAREAEATTVAQKQPEPAESKAQVAEADLHEGFNIEVKKVDPSTEPTIRMATKMTGPSILARETTVIPDVSGHLSETHLTRSESTEIKPEQQVEIRPEPVSEPIQPAPQEQTAPKPMTEQTPIKDSSVSVGGVTAAIQAGPEISVNLDKFSTMNLQAELRENMEKLQEETGEPLREKEEKLPERSAEPDKELTELKPSSISDKISTVPVPDQFKNMISQEYDGQMSLNVPEDEEPVDDKQITGQMDIESILAEWDKLQDEAREKRIRNAKRKSLEQTNDIAKGLVEVMPGYQLPKVEEPQPEPVKEETKPDLSKFTQEAESTTPTFTAPLVIPDEEEELPEIEEVVVEEPAEELERKSEREPERESEREPVREPEEKEELRREPVRKKPLVHEKPQPKKSTFVTDQTVQLPSVFDTFLHIKGLGPQLKEAEEKLTMDSAHGNALIIGSEQAARLELIQAFARDMGEQHPKMKIRTATIDADVFNGKDVAKSLKALAGNILVIERAGHLSDDAMHSLLSVLSDNEQKILVILEDSKSGAKNLSEYTGFNTVFDVVVDIPTLSNDYLVSHAREYAAEKNYTLDDMAVLALYQRIDERQTADHVVGSDEVEKIIDAAIRKSNKKNLKHLGDVLFAKRYNDDDMIILREKDFTK